MNKFRNLRTAAILLVLASCSFYAQELTESPVVTSVNRERGLRMLDQIKELISEHYYDVRFNGIDLNARFNAAKERVKTLNTNPQIFRVIAQVLLEFDDSHTTFYPPGRANRVEYGFSMQMIGVNCYVVDVKKGSDAEAKGLKAGDKIVQIAQYVPNRDHFWKINYILYSLDPMATVNLKILDRDGTSRSLEINASFKSIKEREKEAEKRRKEKSENPYKCQEINAETVACKLTTFSVEKKFIDRMMKEVSGRKKLVIDLRGNRGGLVSIEEYLTGHFFETNVNIATFVTRNKSTVRVAKTQKDKVFKGELVVLIDSESASAAEVFARVIQLEKRGKIVGDVSAGAVMTSYSIPVPTVRGSFAFTMVSIFGLNVTVADLIMRDGKRLEKVGVIPDYPVGPTPDAIFEGSDPVLSFAASLMGAKLTPTEAGKFNFRIKKQEDEGDESSDKSDN